MKSQKLVPAKSLEATNRKVLYSQIIETIRYTIEVFIFPREVGGDDEAEMFVFWNRLDLLIFQGECSGQSVTASDFGSNGPRFESGRGRCVESLDKALYSHCPKEKPSH